MTKAGYTFGGWFKENTFTNRWNFTTDTVTTVTTLYARWDDPVFTSISAFKAWLDAQPNNTTATAYSVKLNVSDLGGSYLSSGSTGNALYTNSTKYVQLDLSDSSFTSIGNQAFANCTKLTGIIIPASVTSIGNSAFSGCTGLTSVTIPSSVMSIGGNAFSNCTGLKSVTILSRVLTIDIFSLFNNNPFSGCTSLTDIIIDNNELTISYISNLNSVISSNWGDLFPASNLSVTFRGGNVCFSNARLTSVTIAEGVTSIGYGAFYGCTGLTSVIIPSSVTSIGYGAFSNCTGLTSLTITEGVTLSSIIGESAFSGCTGLTSVTIPSSVAYIYSWAFSDGANNGPTRVTFGGSSTICYSAAFPSADGVSLYEVYSAAGGGAGTYIRGTSSWTKQ